MENQHHQTHAHHEKKGFFKWLVGNSGPEFLEHLSIMIIVAASLLIFVGITVGTFVPGIPVFLAILGSLFVLVGILTYIAAELLKILKS